MVRPQGPKGEMGDYHTIGIAIGLGLAGFLIYEGLQSVSNHVYCPVLTETFSEGLNNKVWTKEVELGGYG